MSDDALPAVLKGNFRSFSTPLPKKAEEWDRRKNELRRRLTTLLGELPPLFTPAPEVVLHEPRDGYTLEKFAFDNGVGDTVYGYLLLPEGDSGPRPAVLYHHYHGGNYPQGKEELLLAAFAPQGHGLIPGEELARAGYVVLGIDAYAFGERRFQGPAGDREDGRVAEESLFKMFLWQGRTLWGMMVRDDRLALNYLLSRPEVDPARIATTGMSMGSTRSWWLAALDERISAVISVGCLTRYQNLIRAGRCRNHGIYYYVPNMLREQIDIESVVGLIAPRPHLTLTGDEDMGSPPDGVRTINEFQTRLYRLYGAEERFRGLLYEGVGHDYTEAMWAETLAWLERWIGAGAGR